MLKMDNAFDIALDHFWLLKSSENHASVKLRYEEMTTPKICEPNASLITSLCLNAAFEVTWKTKVLIALKNIENFGAASEYHNNLVHVEQFQQIILLKRN